IGWFNLASTVPYHASQMYARNLTAFLTHLVKDGKLQLNASDEIIRDTLLTKSGEIVNPRAPPAHVPHQRARRHRRGRRHHSRRRTQKQSRRDSRHHRHRRRHQQHRRRLPDHRPHAAHVQIQRAEETIMPTDTLIEITYLIATALFILSLKWLSSPTTARHGVWAGEIGMALAIGGTLLYRGIVDYKLVAIGLVLGCIIGVPLGKVAMTAVPQRTALSHSFGALCVTLVGTSEFYLRAPNISPFMMAVLSMEVILGSLTFTRSLMAAGQLQEILPQPPTPYKGQNFVNRGMLALAVASAAILVMHPEHMNLFPAMI